MTWDDYFLDLAATAAKKSKDPNSQVGVAIADRHHGTVATGFNGLPIGLNDSEVQDRETKLRRILHAEVNALIFADPRRLSGATLYTTKAVCHRCAAVVCQYHGLYGPLTVVQPAIERESSWAESQVEAVEMFREARMAVRFVMRAGGRIGVASKVPDRQGRECRACRWMEKGECSLDTRELLRCLTSAEKPNWEPKMEVTS